MATIMGPDGKARCRWSRAAPEFLGYHDTEWGFPVADDHRLLEKLCLEGFQSGLSWRTILAKRDNFRAAFHDLIGRALIKMRTMRLPDLLGVDPASHESLARTGGFCNTSK